MEQLTRLEALESVRVRAERLTDLLGAMVVAESMALHVQNARAALQGAVEAISDAILEIE